MISKVEDYLTQSLKQANQHGKIAFTMRMFSLKEKHGFVEEKKTVSITIDVNTNMGSIQDKLSHLVP